MREWHGLYETRVVVLALQSSASSLRTCNDVMSRALGGSFHIWVQSLHQKFGGHGWGLDLDARWPLYTDTYHTYVWLFTVSAVPQLLSHYFRYELTPNLIMPWGMDIVPLEGYLTAATSWYWVGSITRPLDLLSKTLPYPRGELPSTLACFHQISLDTKWYQNVLK